ncbi:MAG: hypothetical protein P4L10_16850 [Acidobacteriaceae bacterium]|nr:hypothetical protein [Acidobacteriaceae bacterium]
MAFYILNLHEFFFNTGVQLGDDYTLGFTYLLFDYYWNLSTGFWNIPWFTPSQCGGLPFLADPNSSHYSLAAILTLFASPWSAIRLSVVTFPLLGLLGSYLLARRGFGLSIAAALLCGVLFEWNGFYDHRMLAGHLAFQGIMLLPLFAWLMLQPGGLAMRLATVGGLGIGFAYLIHAAMAQLLLPFGLTLAIVTAIRAAKSGWTAEPWIRVIIGGLLGLGLSAQRLVASFALLAHFPRSDYLLPGFDGLWTSFKATLIMVFYGPDIDRSWLTNVQWLQDRHELEYSMTPLPLVLFASVIAVWSYQKRVTSRSGKFATASILAIVVAAALGVVPVLLNWYQPQWNAFLKSLPIIGSSSTMIRWLTVYLLPVALLTALSWDWLATRLPRLPEWSVLIAIAAVMAFQSSDDRSFYHQHYNAQNIEQAWHRAAETGVAPPITAIGVFTNKAGQAISVFGGNDIMTQGYSQLLCYQPMLGYRLENLVIGHLHPGSVFDTQDGWLNIKNPACYVYPDENHCRPGDEFRADQRAQAQAFAAYKPFDFAVPLRQVIANWMTRFSAVFVLLLMGAAAVIGLRQTKRSVP